MFREKSNWSLTSSNQIHTETTIICVVKPYTGKV